MAEYIEREDLIRRLELSIKSWGRDCNSNAPVMVRAYEDVLQKVKNLPTADVVKVVRCENCKHLTIHNSPTLYAYCKKTHYSFEPFKTDTRTHFCGFGELKECEEKCVNIKE